MLTFNKKSTPQIGVDISATAIKLLELSRSGNSYRVESYAVEPLPANSVVDKNITEIEPVGEAIGRAVKKSGSKTKHGCAAVAGSAVITKVIQMPAGLSDAELEDLFDLTNNDTYLLFGNEVVVDVPRVYEDDPFSADYDGDNEMWV